MAEPVELFISYSHKDEALKEELEDHLSSLKRSKLISVWHDRKIGAGTEWAGQIKEHLDSAHIILLLISAKFLASDYIYDIEMKRAMERHEAGEARVIPIILRPVDWELMPFQKLQALPTNSQPVVRWEDSDEAFTVIAQEIRQVVEEIFAAAQKPARAPPAIPPPEPTPRTPFFTGRNVVLERLRRTLERHGRAALSGLGGIGKTQTALEYARQYAEHYAHRLWAKANTRDQLLSDLAFLARELELPEKNDPDLEVAAAAVKGWLDVHGGWLLVLDNADELAWLREFPHLPKEGAGHLLLTTRANASGGIAEVVEIREMEPEEGSLFLLRRAKKISGQAELVAASERDRVLAQEIVEEVAGLPLALDQAGAFIEEMQRSLAEYLELYRSAGKGLRGRRGQLAADHESVAVTYSMAFEQVAEESEAAADLIRLCAFLAPDAIPEEIFTQGAAELGENLAAVASIPLKFAEAVESAGRFSLIRRDPARRTLDQHRLVQQVVQDEMKEHEREVWAERAVNALLTVLPSPKYENWPQCERLLPHAQAAAKLIDDCDLKSPMVAALLTWTAYYLEKRGQYTQAETLCERSLEVCESRLGPKHTSTAVALNNLANLYRTQGRYEQAEPALRRALQIWETELGPKHPHVAKGLDSLGDLCRQQGRYSEAEPLFKRSLEICETALGPERPETATVLNNLALLYDEQGRYQDSEPLYRRALDISETALGAEDPDTATSLSNLAGLYRAQGRYGQAEPLYRRALQICENVLGRDHPHVAKVLQGLGQLYTAQERYEQAEPVYERALQISVTELPEHPDTATLFDDVARLYFAQERYEKAEPFFRRALQIRETALGSDHFDVVPILHNLAWTCWAQGRYEQAEPLYRRALQICETALGPKHPHVASVLESYSMFLYDIGRSAEGEKLRSRAVVIRALARRE